MKKIKVLQLVWRFSTGGAEKMVVNIHNHFNHTNIVSIKTLSFTPASGCLFENNIENLSDTVEFIPDYFSKYKVLKRPLRKLFYHSLRKKWFLDQVKTYKPDIIHIHLANLAAELYDACRSIPSDIKVIYHMHSMPETIEESRRRIIKKAIVEGKYYPICVTEFQKNSAIKYYCIDVNTPVLYNGIDTVRFLSVNDNDIRIKDLKTELQIANSEFVIGCVGRGAEVKNYPLVSRIIGKLSEYRETVLLIVGDISDDLKSLIKSNTNKARVLFLGQRNDTELLYRLMHVFVIASFYESSSIVTVEAQLSGVPCVISDCISDEVIISNRVEKVSPLASEQVWVDAILKTKKEGFELYKYNRFEFEKTAEELMRIYRSISNANNE